MKLLFFFKNIFLIESEENSLICFQVNEGLLISKWKFDEFLFDTQKK